METRRKRKLADDLVIQNELDKENDAPVPETPPKIDIRYV